MASPSTPASHLKALAFLSGGGEMGELTRDHDWSANTLGPIQGWPQSLLTTVSIVLNSKFPMFLFWGNDLIQFYNDAYRPSLGNNGKHPSALGQRGEDCWQEIWLSIKPLIDAVFRGEEASWSEDQLLPIYRNGNLEDVYWTFSYSPIKDESGKVGGVLVTCSETTQKVLNLQKSEEKSQQLLFAIEAAELATWDYNPATDTFSGNERIKEWFGLRPEENIELRSATDAIVEKDRSKVIEAIQKALIYSSKSDGSYDIEYTIRNAQTYQERIVRAKGKAWFNEDKIAYRFNGTLQDVTEQVYARKKIEASEQRFRSLHNHAPVAIVLFRGRELIIEMPNQQFINMLGKSENIAGKRLVEAMPELVGQPFLQILDDVYTTGIPFQTYATQVNVFYNGTLKEGYYDFSYTPLFDEENKVYAILEIAEDVTENTLVKKQLEKSESNMRNMILQSPVAMCILKGNDFVVEVANDRILEIWGKTAEQILHKPIFDELPDAKAQGLDALLSSVLTTGKALKAYGIPIQLPRESGIESVYVDFVYEAFHETSGEISGVMVVASDVTEQVLARQKIEEADTSIRNTAERLQLALDAGKLGSYELTIATGQIDCTPQCKQNFGTQDMDGLDYTTFSNMIVPEDREEVKAILKRSIADHTVYNAEYRIIRPDGMKRWIKASGRPVYNEKNEVVKVVGITLDITEHKTFAEELSKQVHQRTLELQRSNEDLLQFAHVASHDLKEPARKVKTFTSRLEDEFGNLLPEKGKIYLGKTQHATDRMYAMIEGVLAYSTLSSSEQRIEDIDLNETIKSIEADLEVLMHQKKGSIIKSTLPVIEGAPVLIYQLFYNLINNSFKFSKTDVAPLITISCTIENSGENTMAKIILADNGIGFENEHTSKIFNAFTRLNSKDKYEGTGLGLALCKKIVERHHGTIEASGVKEQGAVFTILLPLKQYTLTS